MTPEMYEEALISRAWVEVSPQAIYREICTTLDVYEPEHTAFRYKISSPMYPLEYAKLTDDDFYDKLDKPWTMSDSYKEAEKIATDLAPVLDKFQKTSSYDKEEMRVSLAKKNIDNFDANYDYLYHNVCAIDFKE